MDSGIGGSKDEDSCGGGGGSDAGRGGSSPDGAATGVGVGSAGSGRTAGGGEGGSGMLFRGGGGGGWTANSYQLPTEVDTCRGCLASWVLAKVSTAGAQGTGEGPCVLPFENMAATLVITVSFILNASAPC